MLETGCKYYKDEAMFHGFIPHIMGTRFDILLIHSDAERLNRLWFHIINELERLDKILNSLDIITLNLVFNSISYIIHNANIAKMFYIWNVLQTKIQPYKN